MGRVGKRYRLKAPKFHVLAENSFELTYIEIEPSNQSTNQWSVDIDQVIKLACRTQSKEL